MHGIPLEGYRTLDRALPSQMPAIGPCLSSMRCLGLAAVHVPRRNQEPRGSVWYFIWDTLQPSTRCGVARCSEDLWDLLYVLLPDHCSHILKGHMTSRTALRSMKHFFSSDHLTRGGQNGADMLVQVTLPQDTGVLGHGSYTTVWPQT